MKRYVRVGLVIVVLALLLGGLFGYLYRISIGAYNAEINAIKQKGEPLTFAELLGGKIPDEQNAALVYQDIFALMDDPAIAPHVETLNTFGSGRDLSDDPEAWNQRRQALSKTGKIFDLLKVAVSKPKCRFHETQDFQNPLDIGTLTENQALRTLERLLRTKAVVAARDGRMEEALDAVELGFRMCGALDEPIALISFLTRLSMVELASSTLTDVIGYRKISYGQAKRLFDILEGINLRQSYIYAMLAERVSGITAMNHYYEQILGKTNSDLLSFNGYRDRVFYLRVMRAAVESTHTTTRERKAKGATYLYDEIPRYAMMSYLTVPVFARSGSKCDQGSVRIRGNQIFLALLAYQDKTGKYPRTLDELRSGLGWEIPKDVFSGKDFVYKTKDKGFILYSIGPDFTDDGGICRTTRKFQSGDILWKMDR